MGEVAPGLFVMNDLVPPGTAYAMDLSEIGLGDGPGLAMSRVDWERLEPFERERLADEIARHDPESALRMLERWLAERAES